jgi:hypothetical protein
MYWLDFEKLKKKELWSPAAYAHSAPPHHQVLQAFSREHLAFHGIFPGIRQKNFSKKNLA